MFEEFYRFREKPFQLAPSPDFLYKSDKHRKALAYLQYGLTENVGIIVLTGEVGSGKTTTARYILKKLGDRFDTAMIANTNITSGQLLRMVQSEFDITPEDTDKAAVLESLNHHLIAQYEAGKRTLLVIDEAQNLSSKSLEEVRMLSNLQSDRYSLLQIILIGQPELLRTLKKPEIRQFTQRVAVYFHLTALDEEETGDYIAHRIKKAGGPEGLFTPDAVQMIYTLSGGIPRSINLICQAALVYGFADEAETIGQDTIQEIADDKIGVGIESEPASAEPAQIVLPLPDDRDGAAVSADVFENFRMEVKGRIHQLERNMADQLDGSRQQVERRLAEEQRQSEGLKQKIGELEKKLAALSQLFEELAKKQSNPTVVPSRKRRRA